MLKVLLASSECVPFSKTGGLADVVGALPGALARLGADARVITPMHRAAKEKYWDRRRHVCDFWCMLGWRNVYVGIEELVLGGITYYLVDNNDYFGGPIYRGGREETEQYAYFCRAILEALPKLDFIPDVIHCNDWQTAMLPLLARSQYPGSSMAKAKYLLTIHNIAFQGWLDFGFARDLLGVDPAFYNPGCLESFGSANFLKAGCALADKINTVSRTYAAEILMPENSYCLGSILNQRSADLCGIVNGIDTELFNPGGDPCTAAPYSAADMSGKAECKRFLQRHMGLEEKTGSPIMAMVTRMTEQKGFDIFLEAFDGLMQNSDLQFVLVGSGGKNLENAMRDAVKRYPGRAAAFFGYDETLSHRVYAGSDFYLMPSLFEPCGLSQLIAMRYGTIPIVRRTGGLADTVAPFDEGTGTGTGVVFGGYNSAELTDAVMTALKYYENPKIMNGLRRNAMETDFSFDVSARKYMRLYTCML